MRGSPLAVKSYGRPLALVSWTSGTRSSRESSCRFETSKDCTKTSAPRRSRPLARSVADQRLLEREPDRVEVRRVLGLGVDPDVLALGEVDDLLQRRAPGRAPSKAVLSGRSSGMRSFARSVLSSASVKSSVNQPVSADAVDRLGRAPRRRTPGAWRRRSCPRSRSRGARRARRPWSRRGRARCSRRPCRSPAGRRRACARAGRRRRRGDRSPAARSGRVRRGPSWLGRGGGEAEEQRPGQHGDGDSCVHAATVGPPLVIVVTGRRTRVASERRSNRLTPGMSRASRGNPCL